MKPQANAGRAPRAPPHRQVMNPHLPLSVLCPRPGEKHIAHTAYTRCGFNHEYTARLEPQTTNLSHCDCPAARARDATCVCRRRPGPGSSPDLRRRSAPSDQNEQLLRSQCSSIAVAMRGRLSHSRVPQWLPPGAWLLLDLRGDLQQQSSLAQDRYPITRRVAPRASSTLKMTNSTSVMPLPRETTQACAICSARRSHISTPGDAA